MAIIGRTKSRTSFTGTPVPPSAFDRAAGFLDSIGRIGNPFNAFTNPDGTMSDPRSVMRAGTLRPRPISSGLPIQFSRGIRAEQPPLDRLLDSAKSLWAGSEIKGGSMSPRPPLQIGQPGNPMAPAMGQRGSFRPPMAQGQAVSPSLLDQVMNGASSMLAGSVIKAGGADGELSDTRLQQTINQINALVAAGPPARPAPVRGDGSTTNFFALPNSRYGDMTPGLTADGKFEIARQAAMDQQSGAIANPLTGRRGYFADQAQTLDILNNAQQRGEIWLLDGQRGQMPTALPRRPQEEVRAEFEQTHMSGARDAVLDRNQAFSGQQRQLGYIDERGQMTATNRLGMLRQLARQNPQDAEVRSALDAAEEVARQQAAARSSPEVVAANREKASARNDAKRARAARQADAMRARMFGGNPMRQRQPGGGSAAAGGDAAAAPAGPSNPFISPDTGAVGPGDREAAKAFIKTAVQGGSRIDEKGKEVPVPPSAFIQATGITGEEDNIQDLHFGIQAQVQQGTEPNTEDLRTLQATVQAMQAAHGTNDYDPFDMTYGFEGQSGADAAHTEVFAPMYKELIGMNNPSEQQLRGWWNRFKSRIRPDTNRFIGGSTILNPLQGETVSFGGTEYPLPAPSNPLR